MGWNTHPFTYSMVTGPALQHKHKADSLDTSDLRGGVETEGIEVKFKNTTMQTTIQTNLYTNMSLWTLHRHLIPPTTLCNLAYIGGIPHSHRMSSIRLHRSCFSYHNCTDIYPDGFNGLMGYSISFDIVCFSLTDFLLQKARHNISFDSRVGRAYVAFHLILRCHSDNEINPSMYVCLTKQNQDRLKSSSKSGDLPYMPPDGLTTLRTHFGFLHSEVHG